MKRDMDLVRKILMVMSEENAGPNTNWEGKCVGFTRDQILHHAHLMKQGGLIDAVESKSLRNPIPIAMPLSITWAGHDFLDAVKDDSLWERAKLNVIKPAGGVAFSVLLEWAKTEAIRRLGIG